MFSPLKRLLRGFNAGGLSLQRQLLLWLLLPQLVLWIAGGFATYRLAAGYANRAIDDSLSQATRALARQIKPMENGLLIDFPRAAQDVLEADPDDRIYYMVSTPPGQFILGSRTLPQPPALQEPRLNVPYFYDGRMADDASSPRPAQPVRVAALYLSYATEDSPRQLMLVQVARSSANREELARSILVDTLLPLSALIVLMTMIVWAGIRAGLAPLARLRGEVESRAPTDLAPLHIEQAPRELQSLARALNELLGAARRNVAAQKRFIGDAAHQLRTPLAGLKSQTELALQGCTDAELRSRLERVHQSATRSAHLVNQLLTLARAEPESALVQDRSAFDLRQLARELTAELVPRALRAGVDLGLDPALEEDGDAVPVRANALLLREALSNLIDNAIRYAGRGSEVTVRVRREGGQAVAEVEDNGPGIPAAERERVFERFVRGTTTGDGCGLGLAIVKEIIERHAGQVELADGAAGGLRVVVRLPLDAGAAA
ncbi:sensor histidine kinase [Azohydromonas lata]|uniref:histidine kinase n=1 Tax=Azohydromonas lata TaxID=45677 RepID=A0ABU5ILV5_9BURK|nr:sensor histidine kinase [Azohydromonas lata]MDZ5459864.1 sensor histidine kinase [Azohydromonas lata]